MGAGAVRGEVAEPDQVHGTLQQDELLGAKSDFEAGGWQGAGEVRDQVYKDHEAPAEDQQLQFVSGSVVSIGLCANPTVSRRFSFYSSVAYKLQISGEHSVEARAREFP